MSWTHFEYRRTTTKTSPTTSAGKKEKKRKSSEDISKTGKKIESREDLMQQSQEKAQGNIDSFLPYGCRCGCAKTKYDTINYTKCYNLVLQLQKLVIDL